VSLLLTESLTVYLGNYTDKQWKCINLLVDKTIPSSHNL